MPESSQSAKKLNPSGVSGAPKRFLSIPISEITLGNPLPVDLYFCIRHRMVKYQNAGDQFENEDLNKLLLNEVELVFCDAKDYPKFETWIKGNELQEKDFAANAPPEAAQIVEAVQDQRRAMMDLFLNSRSEPQVKQAVDASKKIVTEFMKKPYAISSIQMLQRHSKGAIDHSVNVSTLAVFLGLRMGYSHQIILENLALGGLFHDLGKTQIKGPGDKMLAEDDPEMKQHPIKSKEMLERMGTAISNEVLMIVSQHHEYLDGSGYPLGLKGVGVYDLARLVSIANIYDDLVSSSKKENMRDRVEEALTRLTAEYSGKLDPRKLEKATKILKYSLL